MTTRKRITNAIVGMGALAALVLKTISLAIKGPRG